MSCFCKKQVTPVLKRLSTINWAVPQTSMPKSLATLADTTPPQETDAQLVDAVKRKEPPRKLEPNGLFDSLSMATQGLKVSDMESLPEEMASAVNSYKENLQPKFSKLTAANVMPLMKLHQIANAMNKVKEDHGIDPANTDQRALQQVQRGPAKPTHDFSNWMSYVPIIKLANALDRKIDKGFNREMSAQLQQLSNMRDPDPRTTANMTRLAAILNAVAAIEEAFGPEALGEQGPEHIAHTVNKWQSYQVYPTPASPVEPTQEQMEQMMQIQELPAFDTSGKRFPVMAPLTASGALVSALNRSVGIDPLSEACGACQGGMLAQQPFLPADPFKLTKAA